MGIDRAKQTVKKKVTSIRVLALDDTPSVLGLYERILCQSWQAASSDSDCAGWVTRVFGEDGAKDGLRMVRPTLCATGQEAIQAVRKSRDDDDPFAIAFVDVRLNEECGLETAEQVRMIDHNVHIVLVTANLECDPISVVTRIPPADRVLYLQKPFHAPEIRQLVLAMGTKWRVEEQLRLGQAWMLDRVRERTVALQQANDSLEEQLVQHQKVQNELAQKVAELERFERLTVGRELRMVRLKQEVNEYARKANLPPPYDISTMTEPALPPEAMGDSSVTCSIQHAGQRSTA
jgi:two-component system, cell cycle sensor histidine kinase and response regulator CckA